MIGRLVVLGTACVAAAHAAAQPAPPLTMTCHLMLRGMPSPDETTFMLIGSDLFRFGGGSQTRISAAGMPVVLGSSTDRGVVTQTSASHIRAGSIVTRRVYWKTGTRPRYMRFTETYDFARQTITTTGEPGDSCHHNG